MESVNVINVIKGKLIGDHNELYDKYLMYIHEKLPQWDQTKVWQHLGNINTRTLSTGNHRIICERLGDNEFMVVYVGQRKQREYMELVRSYCEMSNTQKKQSSANKMKQIENKNKKNQQKMKKRDEHRRQKWNYLVNNNKWNVA